MDAGKTNADSSNLRVYPKRTPYNCPVFFLFGFDRKGFDADDPDARFFFLDFFFLDLCVFLFVLFFFFLDFFFVDAVDDVVDDVVDDGVANAVDGVDVTLVIDGCLIGVCGKPDDDECDSFWEPTL